MLPNQLIYPYWDLVTAIYVVIIFNLLLLYAEYLWSKGVGDFLIKVGRDVRRVQNLGRAKSARKPNAQAKSAQNPNDRASFQKL